MDRLAMCAQLYDIEDRYYSAILQQNHLQKKVDFVTQRYRKARVTGNRPVSYGLRLRLVTMEGMLNMYKRYVEFKYKAIQDLRFKLYGEDPDSNSDQWSD